MLNSGAAFIYTCTQVCLQLSASQHTKARPQMKNQWKHAVCGPAPQGSPKAAAVRKDTAAASQPASRQAPHPVTHQSPVSPSHRPLIRSPVMQPAASTASHTSASIASSAASALLCTCGVHTTQQRPTGVLSWSGTWDNRCAHMFVAAARPVHTATADLDWTSVLALATDGCEVTLVHLDIDALLQQRHRQHQTTDTTTRNNYTQRAMLLQRAAPRQHSVCAGSSSSSAHHCA